MPCLQGRSARTVQTVYFKVLWKGYPPDVATWEPASAIHDDMIDEFEAALEADDVLEQEDSAAENGDEEDDGLAGTAVDA